MVLDRYVKETDIYIWEQLMTDRAIQYRIYFYVYLKLFQVAPSKKYCH